MLHPRHSSSPSPVEAHLRMQDRIHQVATMFSTAVADSKTHVISVTMNNAQRLFSQYLVMNHGTAATIRREIVQAIRNVLLAARSYQDEQLYTCIFIKRREDPDAVTVLEILDARALARAIRLEFVVADDMVVFGNEQELDVVVMLHEYELDLELAFIGQSARS